MFTSTYALTVVILGCAHYAITFILLYRKRASEARRHYCVAPPRYPSDGLMFGLSYFLAQMKAVKANNFLHFLSDNFKQYGQTFTVDLLGKPIIFTKESALFREVLSKQSSIWGLEHRRIPFRPLFEDSFFVVGGPKWKQSRDDIRPALSKTEYSDLPRLEPFVQNFLARLPIDGSTVDFRHHTELFVSQLPPLSIWESLKCSCGSDHGLHDTICFRQVSRQYGWRFNYRYKEPD